ncbi:MAG: hypothetical protein K2G65_05860 [Eubacterium sp.]|nr:hypothetical protein [Eubacterium sp.]
MSSYLDDEKAIMQNLIDAGCSNKDIDELMEKLKEGDLMICMKKLADHRVTLLDDLHRHQKCIDCLDYLVYIIEKENGD